MYCGNTTFIIEFLVFTFEKLSCYSKRKFYSVDIKKLNVLNKNIMCTITNFLTVLSINLVKIYKKSFSFIKNIQLFKLFIDKLLTKSYIYYKTTKLEQVSIIRLDQESMDKFRFYLV